ncbi:MAG: type 1 glutamine amidotransferase [Gloeomargarita sp. HHBFW_bins_162]
MVRPKAQRVLVFAHSPDVTLGTFAEVLHQESIAYEYLKMWEGQAPRLGFENYSHVVLLGGIMGAYEADKYEFLRREYDYLEQIFAQEMPVLGICLGAQMLAHFLGAKVAPGAHGQEIGWTPITRLEPALTDPVVSHVPAEMYFFQWHGDAFALPQGAAWLFTSTVYPQQGFRYGAQVWGLQFHPEVDEQIIQTWWRDAPEPWRSKDIITESAVYLPQAMRVGQTLWRQFLAQGTNGLQ